MNILVTGSQGQIGHELLHSLAALGAVTGVDLPQLDLTKANDVRTFIDRLRPQLIVNAAAYTAVDRAETEPDLAHAVNATAVEILAQEAKRIDAAMIHYSTDYVFDGAKRTAYTPDDTPNPQSVYGRTKLAGEQALQASGASYLILRTAWVYGLRGRNFLLAVLDHAQNKNELRIVNDQTGSPTWCRTVAHATADIAQHALTVSRDRSHFNGKDGIYHVTCAGAATWFDFARHIFSSPHVSHRPRIIPISSAEYAARARRPANSVLDCSLTHRTFNTTMTPWQAAIDRVLAERAAAITNPSHSL
jgi:dTDP-4-dehydrorhamnose reductase